MTTQRKGFTLVEIMVVTAVTALLSSLILVYNASTRETLRLFTEKARMAQLVLRSKSLALSTYSQGETACGYGLYIDRDNNKYAMVAYRPESCNDRSRVFTDPSYFEVVQNSEFTLTGALEFADQEEVQVAAYYILFIPPDPTVLIAYKDGSLITTSEGKVIMRVKGQEQRAEITVNAAGQVTF